MTTKAKARHPLKALPEFNEQAGLQFLREVLRDRMAFAEYLGKSFGNRRSLYEVCGYPEEIDFGAFWARFKRQDMAKAIIQIPVRASWRYAPKVTESGAKDSPFEKDWKHLVKDHKVYHYLARLDTLAGIGEYAIMVLGLDDGLDLNLPAEGKRKLIYLQPYGQGSCEIVETEKDGSKARYGKPTMYRIKTRLGKAGEPQSVEVHWTRVLHACEEPLESDVFGTSRLEAPYNRLQDLDNIAGGSAEMFWRSAWNGLAFIADKDVTPTPGEKEEFEQKIWQWINGLDRIIRLRGMNVENLNPTISSPREHFDVIVDLISAVTRIPRRLLLGSERGELASTTDEENWGARVAERQRDHCETLLLRPFIDTVVRLGIVSPPGEDGIDVVWPEGKTTGALESSQIGKTKAEAAAIYVGTPGMDTIIPPEIGLKEFVGFEESEIERIDEILAELPPIEDDIPPVPQVPADPQADAGPGPQPPAVPKKSGNPKTAVGKPQLAMSG